MRKWIKAAFGYFAWVFAAGFLLGALRVLVVVPRLGELFAVLLELPVMLTVSWFACRAMVGRFAVPAVIGARLAMGGTAFALLMAAEAAFAVALGRTIAQHVASLLTAASLLGLAGQIGFALLPLIQLRGRRAAAG